MSVRGIRVVRGLEGGSFGLLPKLDRSIDNFALLREKAGKQPVGLAKVVVLEEGDELGDILRELIQFSLLLGRAQTEPALGFLCMPRTDPLGYP